MLVIHRSPSLLRTGTVKAQSAGPQPAAEDQCRCAASPADPQSKVRLRSSEADTASTA